MKAIEFTTRITSNLIEIPNELQSELTPNEEKLVRVIVLFEDPEKNEDLLIKKASATHFFEGFEESDSIYESTPKTSFYYKWLQNPISSSSGKIFPQRSYGYACGIFSPLPRS